MSFERRRWHGHVVLVSLAVVWLMAGCDDTEDVDIVPLVDAPARVETLRQVDDQLHTIGLVLKTLVNPFFVDIERGARLAAQDFGLGLTVRSAAHETSAVQQIAIVDEMLGSDIDAFVISPVDSVRLVPILKQVSAGGFPVITVDTPLDAALVRELGMVVPPFVGIDNEAAAYRVGAYLAERATPPVDAAVIEGLSGNAASSARLRGVRRAFAETPGLRLVAMESGAYQIDRAYGITVHLLQRFPDLGVLVSDSDHIAIGALRAIREAGRGGNHHPLVSGFGALDEAKMAIADGVMQVTVDQQGEWQGYIAVYYALRMIEGRSVPPQTLVDAILVHGGTLGDG